MHAPARALLAVMIAVSASAACATAGSSAVAPAQTAPIVQPGAPGQASRVIDAAQATSLPRVLHTAADTAFMQRMIAHHSQALEMTALRAARSTSDDLRLMALRIELSQADEIAMMRGWLTARGEPLSEEHAHHTGHGALMPGMLTPGEMAMLAGARGAEFDRLFLELMIKHHEGALVMVDALFATAGAGQESDVFAFASDVVDDQRIEIQRMAAMLKELQK